MDNASRTLGDQIFAEIDDNTYLHELYDILLFNYGMWRFGHPQDTWRPLTSKDRDAAMRFADLLSKSTHPERSDAHKNWAQELCVLATTLYPDDDMVRRYAGAVFQTLSNHLALEQVGTTSRTSVFDELYEAIQERHNQVPGQPGTSFFPPQTAAYNKISHEAAFSFSAPTSLGKSFIIRTYIETQLRSRSRKNFVVLVPSKALINETRRKFIDDLKEDLERYNYRIVTSVGDIVLEGKHNFIFVLTPERLLYLLISKPAIKIDHVFVDEAHKIAAKSSRAAFYSQVVSILKNRPEPPRFTFSSPNIPNPEVFLELVQGSAAPESLAIGYSPVTQFKFTVDATDSSIYVFNERTKQSTCIETRTHGISLNNVLAQIGRPLPGTDRPCQTLVYVNSKRRAADLARKYVDEYKLPVIGDAELEALSRSIQRDIQEDYYLAELVRKGVAYHIGYLPPAIREKLEDLYRSRKIQVFFCTSTLLEGVNLPADNLVVVDYKNGMSKFSPVDFKNLTGRVGRIEFNLYGNVFLYAVDKSKRDTAEDLVTKEVQTEELAIEHLTKQDFTDIVEALRNGKTRIPERRNSGQEIEALKRKFALILLREITTGREGYVTQRFAAYLTTSVRDEIREKFAVMQRDQDDDINISIDQAESLDRHLDRVIETKPNASPYPLPDVNKRFDFNKTLRFLEELARVYDWTSYERTTLGKQKDGRYSLLRWYAVILNQWMEGKGLRQIMNQAIAHHRSTGNIMINRKLERFVDRPSHRNIVYNEVLEVIENIILFRIANYFLRLSNEFKEKAGIEDFPNDWYEYVEYGTNNAVTIGLQRLGFSRENSTYLRAHPEYYQLGEANRVFLKAEILDCPNPEVRMEAAEICFNAPEYFLGPKSARPLPPVIQDELPF